MTTNKDITDFLLKKIYNELNALHLSSIRFLQSRSRIHICIHELRTNNKKIRALLRLIKSDISANDYILYNSFYRDMNRDIAVYRDISSQIELLSNIKKNFRNELVKKAVNDAIKQFKINRKVVLQLYLSGNLRNDYMQALEEKTISLNILTEEIKIENVIGKGVKSSYRNAVKLFNKCLKTNNDDDFHEWRKNVKYLLYQFKTIRSLWPSVINAYISELNLLSSYLGNIHDLSLFKVLLTQNQIKTENQQLKKSLQASVRNQLHQLKNKSTVLGKLIFVEKAKDFCGRLESYYYALKQN